jgi:hypothetical protein
MSINRSHLPCKLAFIHLPPSRHSLFFFQPARSSSLVPTAAAGSRAPLHGRPASSMAKLPWSRRLLQPWHPSPSPSSSSSMQQLLPFFSMAQGTFLVRARAVSSPASMARCPCPPSHGALIPPCAVPLFFYLLPAPRNSSSEQRTSCCPRRAANGELSSTSPHGCELPSPAARLPLPWKPAASCPPPNRCPFFLPPPAASCELHSSMATSLSLLRLLPKDSTNPLLLHRSSISASLAACMPPARCIAQPHCRCSLSVNAQPLYFPRWRSSPIVSRAAGSQFCGANGQHAVMPAVCLLFLRSPKHRRRSPR